MERGPQLSVIEQAKLEAVMRRYAERQIMQSKSKDGEEVSDMTKKEKRQGIDQKDIKLPPDPWSMSRYGRRTDPVDPILGPRIPEELQEAMNRPRIAKRLELPEQMREEDEIGITAELQAVWPSTPKKNTGIAQIPGSRTRVGSLPTNTFQEVNYQLLHGIETDKAGENIVPEERLVEPAEGSPRIGE